MLIAFLIACTAAPIVVTLDGPAELKVESLGPVALPGVHVTQGDAPIDPTGLVWTADPATVATIDGANLLAVGPGTATVKAAIGASSASFALTVAPAVTISFVDPPASLAVGGAADLRLRGQSGGQDAPIGAVVWSSSNDAVATVSADGKVAAIGAGRAYLTAKAGESEAMLELDVTAP